MNAKKLIGLVAMLAFAGAVGAGCGDDGDDGGGGGGGGLTAQEFETQALDTFASSLCKSSYQCPEEQEPNMTLFASRFGTEEECRDGILSMLGIASSINFTDSIDRGLAEFNAEKAQECMDAIDALAEDACFNVFSTGSSPSPACDEVLTGLQPAGAPCDSDDHCASGTCDFTVDTADACWMGECAESAETTVRAEGESCSGENEECDTGLVCDTAGDGQSQVCVAEDSRSAGEPCTSASVCSDGLACANSTCTELTLAADGESCDMQQTFCQPGLVCAFTLAAGVPTGSCSAPKAQGENCFQDFSCEAGLQCEGADFATGTAGTCEATLAEGEDCETNFDCQSGLTCGESGTCEAPGGEVCEIPTDAQDA